MESRPLLEVRDVSMVFGSGENAQYALRDVDLAVHDGEVLMLRGPSGSGKTTLLSIMGGILSPTSGEVFVDGHAMTKRSTAETSALRLQYFGFIFQDYNLFPTLSCSQNIQVALDLRGIGRGDARRIAARTLQEVGLGNKQDEMPAKLSGGQKQRLAVARALAGSPKVMLADEPTAALDSANGLMIMALLRDLAHARGRAVVVVTHDDRIMPYADRVVHIEDGRIKVPG
ncbi:ABC transporter ATP-binding protein [Nitratidesulfovibrio sp. SRB-5]|uniref:ABC transporter ATP-binding protein n=1 Tax=Nitratidesulfovibrio sp. SRB-5 TaxID=2872636 RepID=UPI0010277EF3|nr:ABC transporter ATP-binding protein [Nitratidesulfovibrio sp. SRB-5]MBZ2172969.1 ABC transporter ATP-binding protein [Nitratidesulfovibrio sp. SRB-5]RXF78496.1 ABC transporter ATP-binding protein [Desulfovibrio sp. DS-1]